MKVGPAAETTGQNLYPFPLPCQGVITQVLSVLRKMLQDPW